MMSFPWLPFMFISLLFGALSFIVGYDHGYYNASRDHKENQRNDVE